MTRRGVAAIGASLLAVFAAAVPSCGTSSSAPQGGAWPANPDWQKYAQGPFSLTITPVAITSKAGSVTGMPSPAGTGATLNYPPGGTPPSIVLDYGKDVGGTPWFDVSQVSGTPTLHAAFSEGLNYLGPDGDGAAVLGDGDKHRYLDVRAPAPGHITTSSIQGGERYELITLSTPGSVTLGAAGLTSIAPVAPASAYSGWFLSSSDLLNKIWYAGAYTAQLDAIPSGTATGDASVPVVVDGAKRDRLVWIGDLAVTEPTILDSTNATDYLRGSLALIGSYEQAGGIGAGFAQPTAPLHTGPPVAGPVVGQGGIMDPTGSAGYYSASYAMYFVIDLAQYYRYTGDLAFVQQEWPVVERQLAWDATQVDSNGLFTTNAVTGYDWDYYDGAKTGEVSEFNILYYSTLNAAAFLAHDAGHPELTGGYNNQAYSLRTAINAHLFNAAAGAYGLSNLQPDVIPQDANALALSSGIANSEQQRGILAALKAGWTPYGPMPFTGGANTYKKVISPFVSSFEVNGRYRTGDASGAQTLLETEWGHMLSPGPDATVTFWESIAADGTPGFAALTSLAHGWSTGASGALTGYVLGIQPFEPGYSTWSVAPHSGTLSWAEGQVPTAHGPIHVAWSTSRGGGIVLEVRAPSSTSGTVLVPLPKGSSVTLNGKQVYAHDSPSAKHVMVDHLPAGGDALQIDGVPGGTSTVLVTPGG